MARGTSTVPEDFDRLVHAHGARIRRIARRYAADGALDDLVQDILMRLWRSYPRFRGEARIESWIYRVALNASMTYVGRLVRERDLRTALSAQVLAEPAPPAGAGPGHVLSTFLAQLGEVDASILMMYLDGLAAEEMSEVLGVSSNVVNVRISRLKQKFSDMYVEHR